MASIVIRNKLRTDIAPVFMGGDYFPVLVSNVGVSSATDSLLLEQKKIAVALKAGANMIADLSMIGNIADIQKRLLEKLSVPLSVVTAYEIYTSSISHDLKTSEDSFIHIIENEMLRGVDLITIHATVFKDDSKLLRETSRLIPTTSRGGAMILEMLQVNNFENPYFTHFAEIVKLAKKYSVCLSLGPCYRPGSVCDCYLNESLHMMEIERMSKLVAIAQTEGVGITVEGIGHAPINEIPALIQKSKRLCHDAPYRVLTVGTDVALGFDHISSAIASAVAVLNGADSITCVSRAEHIGLPTVEEIEEAVVAAKIAAHCGYIARTKDFNQDYQMSLIRHKVGCIGNPDLSLYPSGAKQAVANHQYVRRSKECTMCGDFCPYNTCDRISTANKNE